MVTTHYSPPLGTRVTGRWEAVGTEPGLQVCQALPRTTLVSAESDMDRRY